MAPAQPTSARQQAANRANARNSTEPRTTAGKARVARNVCRRGLSRAGRARSRACRRGRGAGARDPGGPDVSIRRRQGPRGSPRHPRAGGSSRPPNRRGGSRRRVRRRRNAAIARAIADHARHGDLVDELARFDRYERRARSRRRFAIRKFDEALLGASQGLRQAVSRCVADVALVAHELAFRQNKVTGPGRCIPAEQSHRPGAVRSAKTKPPVRGCAFRQNKAIGPAPLHSGRTKPPARSRCVPAKRSHRPGRPLAGGTPALPAPVAVAAGFR